MKIFSFFISNFRDIFQNFQISIQISKLIFPHFFHFLWPIIFTKFKKNSIQISKMIFFSKFFILNFPYDINKFFLSPRLPNLLKDYKNYLFILTKIILYCIPPLGDTVHRKRSLELYKVRIFFTYTSRYRYHIFRKST
jgi:hypothetical protein